MTRFVYLSFVEVFFRDPGGDANKKTDPGVAGDHSGGGGDGGTFGFDFVGDVDHAGTALFVDVAHVGHWGIFPIH